MKHNIWLTGNWAYEQLDMARRNGEIFVVSHQPRLYYYQREFGKEESQFMDSITGNRLLIVKVKSRTNNGVLASDCVQPIGK